MRRSFKRETLEGKIIRMYSSPKIIASLDAAVVLTQAHGSVGDGGSHCEYPPR
jgi:hypothetical protein